MLSNQQINEIHRLHWHQKWSLRQIARHLNLNRRTVAKYLIQPAPPRPRPQRTSKLEPFHAAIGKLLEQDPHASAVVILQRLRGRGFDGGITILKDHLHQVRTESAARRAYVRVESPPGDRFEIDWGHFGSLEYSGDTRKLYAFSLVECHSRMMYVEFTHSQCFETFMCCHIHAFQSLGGIARHLVYDNLATAVAEHEGNLVRFHPRFLAFAREFGFLPRACHVASLAAGIRRISARRPGKGKIMTLAEKLERLRLPTMSCQLDQALQHAAEQSLSPAAAMEWLVDLELEARHGRAVQRRYHFSRLHGQHSIDSFLFQHHKSRLQNKSRILRLLDLDFIDKGTNIVLLGNPGTGKTFLSKIIGWRACQANRRVLFTTAMDMLNQLIASQVDHSLVRRLKFYTDPALLICDELGYLALDQQTSNLFYQVISSRHGLRRSTVITTNTAFSEWGNILHNTTIATAIADRLVENSEVVMLGGDSLRKGNKGQPA